MIVLLVMVLLGFEKNVPYKLISRVLLFAVNFAHFLFSINDDNENFIIG